MSVRFAPSPTGAFHIGNFRTAWVSSAWAQKLSLPWVVRFENIDQPRNVPGARERQLEEMKQFGWVPDRTLLQSDFHRRHWEVFLRFYEEGLVYPCFCSRKMIREAVDQSASAPHGAIPSYTGRCRELKEPPETDLPTLAWRIRLPDPTGKDDFVVARTGTELDDSGKPDAATFAPAYHWACAIDDYDGDHALLVRAWDLEEAAVQQRFIHSQLARLEGTNKPPPAIFHASLVTSDDGSRLEKRTISMTLPELLRAGETAASLLKKFKKSFTGDWEAFEPSKIFGEGRKRLGLRDFILVPP